MIFETSSIDGVILRLEKIESQIIEIQKSKVIQPYVLLTTKEAAQALQITTRHLQNLRDRGDIGFVQDGRSVRYKPEQIQAYIDSHCINPSNWEGGVS